LGELVKVQKGGTPVPPRLVCTMLRVSVPPALVVTLFLAEDSPLARRLDFHEIAMHRTHAVIEPLRQVIELHKLLRQVAPGIGEMQHAPVGRAHFQSAAVPH